MAISGRALWQDKANSFPIGLTVMMLSLILALTFPTNPEAPQYDPTHAYYLVQPGQGFDGVVLLELTDPVNGAGHCTGSLLRSGRHILTAAHCVEPERPAGINVIFELSRQTARSVRQIQPVADNQNLVALELTNSAPVEAMPEERYRIEGGQQACFGLLAEDRQYLLTAADCVDRDRPEALTVQFTWYERVARSVQTVHVHPAWQPENPDAGHDLAILELTTAAPATAERYALYRRHDERGQTFIRVGYGLTGSGVTGEVPLTAEESPQKRLGGNRYDAWGDILDTVPPQSRLTPEPERGAIPTLPEDKPGFDPNPFERPPETDFLPVEPFQGADVTDEPVAAPDIVPTLVYDFDSGGRTHDALGQQYGVYDLRLLQYTGQANGIWRPQNQIPLFNLNQPFPVLPMESGIGKGDSGSPAFIDGRIAGIASRQIRSTVPGTDITGEVDGSFGEIFVDMRISAYIEFIDSILEAAAAAQPADQR